MYDKQFYQRQLDESGYSQNRILSIVLPAIGGVPKSAIDIGCGMGQWLKACSDAGIKHTTGVEGPWLKPEHMVHTPSTMLSNWDLATKDAMTMLCNMPRHELAICLEVAEHLPEEYAEKLVYALKQSSDYVLFSAAIPGQGGTGHVNEQWQSYWVELFAKAGYECHDILRPAIWSDRQIPFWYRQNILLFSDRMQLPGWNTLPAYNSMPVDLVHPKAWSDKCKAR